MRHIVLLAIVGGAGAAAALAGLAYYASTADRCAPGPEVVFNVTASRYRFEPGTDAAISVPRCATVVLQVTSIDVVHGIAIRGYNVQEQVAPGSVVEIRFVAEHAGDFAIYCTAFCGPGHPDHKGTLHVA